MYEENNYRALRTYGHQTNVSQGAVSEPFYKLGFTKKLFGLALMIGGLGQSRDACGKFAFVKWRREMDDPRVCRRRVLITDRGIEPDQKHSDIGVVGAQKKDEIQSVKLRVASVA